MGEMTFTRLSEIVDPHEQTPSPDRFYPAMQGGGIRACIPVHFEDTTEGTLVVEVDAGMAETFLDGVAHDDVEEILCKNLLQRVAAYEMPIADSSGDEFQPIKWKGNPHYLRQLRKHEFGAETVAFIVTQAGLDVLERLWPFDEIRFYR